MKAMLHAFMFVGLGWFSFLFLVWISFFSFLYYLVADDNWEGSLNLEHLLFPRDCLR